MIRTCASVTALGLVLWSTVVVPRPVAALDLPEALRQAASANPSLAARAAMVDAARRRVAPAGAWPSPMLELGVVNVPTNGRFDMDMMTMKMVGVSQRVPVFGSNRLSRSAAREGVTRESAAAEMTGFEILGMTWEAYADARISGELAQVTETHIAVMDRLVQSARARFESGNGRLEDMLRAQAERAGIIRDMVSFRAEERSARARLDALRGIVPGGTPGAATDTLAPLPSAAAPVALDLWLAELGPEHPRLREIEATTKGYRLSARAARRMIWPDLELRASYGIRGALEGGTDLDNMFSASVGFMLPIFAGARERSEGAEMDAMARASDAERRGAELELRRAVVSAHADAAGAARTVGLLADSVIAIQHRAVEASWTSYRAGTTDLWRVFESTHALYGEEVALVRARQERARADARLVSLTGRADLLGVALPSTRSER